MKYILASTLVALAVTGCATSPERIAPVANAGPCTEADRARLAEISKKQTATADADAFGVFMLGVPVGSFIRDDHEAEIAILKGRCG